MKKNLQNIDNLEYSIKEFNIEKYVDSIFGKIDFAKEKDLKQSIDNFKYNLISTITTMRVPFLVSIKNISDKQWMNIAIDSGLEVKDKEKIDQLYYEWLTENWEKNLSDIDNEIKNLNNRFLNEGDYLQDNLLYGATHLWSLLEVFYKDLFIILLNNFPNEIFGNFKKNQYLNKRLKDPTIEVLIEYEFNLSNKMGNIVFNEIDFSNYQVFYNIHKSIFEDILISNDIFELCQIRHLVIHKCGIIDKPFKDKIKINQNIGEKIDIKAVDIYRFLEIIQEYLIKILTFLNNRNLIIRKTK